MRQIFLTRQMLPSWAIFVICLTSLLLVAVKSHAIHKSNRFTEFESATSSITQQIERLIGAHLQLIRIGVGLINTGFDVNDTSWSALIDSLDLRNTYPGIQGIGVARVIARHDLLQHQEQMRKAGATNYHVFPDGTGDMYTPIVFLAPKDWRNARAIGFDMYSDPARRAAMTRARDNNEPSMTTGLRLVQETDEDQQWGVLIYLPFYSDRIDPRMPSLRQTKLEGFVYGAFRIHDLIESAIGLQNATNLFQVALRIKDADGTTIYNSSLTQPTGTGYQDYSWRTVHHLSVAGQPWTLDFLSRQTAPWNTSWSPAWQIIGIGMLLTLLVTFIATHLTVSRAATVAANRALETEIARRQSAESQLNLANNELVHRVKNMMGIVQSIARQTARHSPTPEIFNKNFSERLVALGRVYDILTPGADVATDLSGLVRRILSPFCDSNSSSLSLCGPDLSISNDTALLLSLVFHELATNSVKYGAWSRPSGSVTLIWTTSDILTLNEARLSFHWIENGGPAVLAPTQSGFGTTLLTFAIERGLKGFYTTSFDEDGFACEIVIPLSLPH